MTTGGSYEDRPAPAARGRISSAGTVSFLRRADYTSETKPFYLTSEFLVFVLYVMGAALGKTLTVERAMIRAGLSFPAGGSLLLVARRK